MKNPLKFLGFLIIVIAFSFNDVPQKVVVIDVGHGGKDSGVSSTEIAEKEINLVIANKIMELSEKSNTLFILSRDSDKFLNLQDRVEYINSLHPTCVVSLHVNSSENENARGSELYISPANNEGDKSMEFAEMIKGNLPAGISESKIRRGNFYLLKNLACPAAILEMGFLSNNMDKAYLMSKKGQNEMAEAIFKSVE